jgi:hypothetical protein
MILATFVLLAQLAVPTTPVRPVLAFPEPALDDSAAYAGYQTRLFRDAAGNTVQIYLDARAQRVVHLFADAEDESIGFTARDDAGKSAALRWASDGARVGRAGRARVLEHDWSPTHRASRSDGSSSARCASSATCSTPAPARRVRRGAVRHRREWTARRGTRLARRRERARHLALLHASTIDELRARTRPTIALRDDGG